MAQIVLPFLFLLGLQERLPPLALEEFTEMGIDYAFPPLRSKKTTPWEKGLCFLSDSDILEEWIESSPIPLSQREETKKGAEKPPFKKE